MSTTFMTWLGFVAMMVIAVCFTWRPAYATLRPPRHRPVAFLFGSLVFLLMAFMFAWLPANAIDTGHIHVSIAAPAPLMRGGKSSRSPSG
ncbi:hypothetical protein C1929_10470 [Stenotrophomonas sp. ZAC14D1_NAIMI4_6]|uniref:hypothetical protein n=1 Tax=unclassified Stenotrophomonas maltophilia group TaxID=2961925 RepID=UPI000D53E27C|nr:MULTISPECIES: hypothetical protein [unclassified Stenotrophomonas maltophilia group]AWH37145.1 hypothetical protein C1929_10470 [Stenotrophomonas sp. ZAC14D1_NAIMI4_6]AWH41335.1 hypothetical protein C1927_10800 [Stenotrophomonas sp. ZAC14D1_NAIMI4_1]